MQYRPLGQTGLNVSALSFGASSLGGVFRAIDEPTAIRAVHTSLELGINFIDVSPYYGATKAETVLGKALRGVARERYYLATKVGQYGEGEFDFSAARVTRGFDESLRRLGVEYVDLLQCHDIEFADAQQIIGETLPALLRLKQAGKARHLGITGLPLRIYANILDHVAPGVVETVLSFCHYELNDDTLAGLLPYLAGKGVGVINASPTGMGLLTERPPPAWHPASPAIQAGCRRAVELCQARGWNIVELAVQFAVANPAIATTLVGSANPDNMRANVKYAETPLDPERLAAVRAVLAPIQGFNFTRGRPEHRDPVRG